MIWAQRELGGQLLTSAMGPAGRGQQLTSVMGPAGRGQQLTCAMGPAGTEGSAVD